MASYTFQPGIYFGLPEDVYHNEVNALSAHGIISLLEHPYNFWLESWLNPDRQRVEVSEAMKHGSATHMAILEPDAFKETYAVAGIDHIEPGKKTVITRTEYRKIKDKVDIIHRTPGTRKFLTGGFAEVSIIWNDPDTSILMKSRHDYIRPFISIDYKTIKDVSDNSIRSALNYRGYGIQCMVYLQSRLAAQVMLRDYFQAIDSKKECESPIYSNREIDEKWLRRFAESTLHDVYLLFQKSESPYTCRTIRLDDGTSERCTQLVNRAKTIFADNYKKHGDKRWDICNGEVEEFSSFYGSISGTEYA